MLEFKRKVRSRNLYNPKSDKPYKLSRSRLENLIRCPHCFYLDRRLGVDQPPTPGFTLNNAVDALMKKEFDTYRKSQIPHPLMIRDGIEAIPLADENLEEWRSNFKGITFHHTETNLIISGAVDDIWVNRSGELVILDYKATSSASAITAESHLRASYVRQIEIYQWLFKRNGYNVSDTGYLVYANALKERPDFSEKLEFEMTILPLQGNTSWVEPHIHRAHELLNSKTPPPPSNWCEYCAYRNNAQVALNAKPDQTELDL